MRNLAECWMYVISKFGGGKVINRSQSGSWENRCMEAGLRQVIGSEWGPQVWKKITRLHLIKYSLTQQKLTAKRIEEDRISKVTDNAKENI